METAITQLEEFGQEFDYLYQEGVVFKSEEIQKIKQLATTIIDITNCPLLITK